MTAALAQRIADGGGGDLEALRRSLIAEVRRALLALNTVPGGSQLARDQARVAADVLRQVNDRLRALGLRGAEEIMARRAAEAVDAIVPQQLRLGVGAQREVQAILSGRSKEIADALGATSTELRRVIQLGTTSGADLDELLRVAEQRIDVGLSRLRTVVDTGIMATSRVALVEAGAAIEGDTLIVYAYEGPGDANTRPFCRPLLGTAYSEAGMAALDNGQGLSVAAFGGGYNCRHVWVPTTIDEARRRGLRVVA